MSLVADLTQDRAHAARGTQKKVLKREQRRELVTFLCTSFHIPQRRACQLIGMQRSSYYYRSRADPQTELRVRLRDLAGVRVRYGYRRLHVLLKREGWQINHKRVYRLYKLEGFGFTFEDKEEACERAACSTAGCECAGRMLEHGFCRRSARFGTADPDADVSG